MNGTNKLSSVDTKDFPDKVEGCIHLHNCKYISTEDIDEWGSFIRDSVEENDEDLDFTEEQQQILDLAAELLSEDEYNALEDFFYNQN